MSPQFCVVTELPTLSACDATSLWASVAASLFHLLGPPLWRGTLRSPFAGHIQTSFFFTKKSPSFESHLINRPHLVKSTATQGGLPIPSEGSLLIPYHFLQRLLSQSLLTSKFTRLIF